MPTRVMEFLHQAMRWIRYAYSMRFSLGLWSFARILCCLNTSPARTLTSGIMTGDPFDREQKTLEAASTWIKRHADSKWHE